MPNERKVSPEATKKKLEEYFGIYIKKGYSIKGLSYFLKSEGYPVNIVDQVADEYRTKAKVIKTLKPILFITLALLIILIPIYLWMIMAPPPLEIAPGITDCGFNKDCFLKLANECSDAVYHQDEAGSVVRYEVTGCELAVSFEKFADDEPEEINTLIGNKKMSCAYARRAFDTSWIDGFLAPVRFCEGELKDTLFALRVAQLTLGT